MTPKEKKVAEKVVKNLLEHLNTIGVETSDLWMESSSTPSEIAVRLGLGIDVKRFREAVRKV